jgi:hypothetical protein
MDHAPPAAIPAEPAGELARVRTIVAFAEATGAPPEALSWLLKLSREAERRRGTDAGDVTPATLAPLLVGPGPGRV